MTVPLYAVSGASRRRFSEEHGFSQETTPLSGAYL
jgi:hypothetical protein